MFLQQIQCMEEKETIDIFQEESRLNISKSKMIEAMVEAVCDDGIVKIDKIICYIDELYEKAKQEQKTIVADSEINDDQAIKCANEQLQKLHSREELVVVLNRLRENNKLEHIIHENGITVETTSSPVSSNAIETAEKALKLDTATLTDLLILESILNTYQEDRQVIDGVITILTDAHDILVNLHQLNKALEQEHANAKAMLIAQTSSKVFRKFMKLYYYVSEFKFKFQFDHVVDQMESDPDLAEDFKKIFSNKSNSQSYKSFDELFKELQTATLKLHAEMTKFKIALISVNKDNEDNSFFYIVDKAYSNNNENANEENDYTLFAQMYVKVFGVPEQSLSELQDAQLQFRTNLNALPSLCLLDPTIEGEIAECLKHVIDPSLYSVYSPQECYTDTPPQTDDSNPSEYTIGSNDDNNTTQHTEYTIGSNDDNNTTQHTIGLSRESTIGTQIAKPADVSASQIDVSAYNDNIDIKKSVKATKSI
jgi:hypothetical protein